jgi:hypothetical protein
MLKTLSMQDEYILLLADDPVRPHIPHSNRIGKNKEVIVLLEDNKPAAIVCVSLQNNIPKIENELFEETDLPTTAVFYTIWSYMPGFASKLIFNAVEYIEENFNSIDRFVTLSPKTEMAKKFHLRNGAFVLNDNEFSVNYEYEILPR